MSSYASKTQGNQSRVSADCSPKQQSSPPAMQFVNNRPEVVAQRRLQSAADNSTQVSQFKALQKIADHHSGNVPTKSGAPIQRVTTLKAAATSQRSPVIQKNGLRPGQLPIEQNVPYWRPAITSSRSGDRTRAKKGVREEKGKTSWGQIAEYGVIASGVASATAGKLTTTLGSGDDINFAGGIMGGVSGTLGGLGDMISMGKGVSGATDKANNRGTRRAARLDTLGAGASLVKSGATAAVNFSDVGSAVATGATTLAGGASLVMGALDMAGGLYGSILAQNRKDRIDGSINSQQHLGMRHAAMIASASQGREATKNKARMVKGAYAVSGGAALLLGAGPIGWTLLSIAAGIGGAAAIYNYIKKRKHKKEMVIEILGIKGVRDEWKARKKQVESTHSFWRRTARKDAMAEIGEDPLDIALKVNGYKDIGHCYNNFVNTAANLLHQNGVIGTDRSSQELIRNMGLKIDPRTRQPHPSKIAAKLSI